MRIREAKRRQNGGQEAPQERPRGTKGLKNLWRDGNVSLFGAPEPPKGLKILEKAAMLAVDCRTAGLEGLKDWRLRI